MGSTIETIEGVGIKGYAGKDIDIPVFIQFVPGVVVEVCTSPNSLRSNGTMRNINTIIAKPHISKQQLKKSQLGENHRYQPLLRGITDVPAKGDPILLCTIGEINYYLGPLNTQNSPNWNEDNLWEPERGMGQFINNLASEDILRGESMSFDKLPFNRMCKITKTELDHPNQTIHGRSMNETHGDMVLEGRHGNSIRIGSRHVDPYIFISNSRHKENIMESLGDGSIISITRHGTLGQHLGKIFDENFGTTYDFVLASDKAYIDSERVKMRTIEKQVESLMKDQSGAPEKLEPKEAIYGFNRNQIFMNSDRIILNSKIDDVILSSANNILIGSGNNLAVSVNNTFILDASKVYFGNPYKREKRMDKMVLGKQLKSILEDILDTFTKVKTITQAGPMPLMDSSNTPLVASTELIKPIRDKIDNILSEYYFIEPNAEKQ